MSTAMTSPAHTLNSEYDAMVRLTATLQKEQAVLNQGQIEQIPDLLTEKANIIAEITGFASQRYQTLAALGYDESEEGMQQWAQEHGEDTDKTAWQNLFDEARIARELNRLNGLVINRHMNENQETLDAIQKILHGGGNLYGPNGQSSVNTSGRQLGIG